MTNCYTGALMMAQLARAKELRRRGYSREQIDQMLANLHGLAQTPGQGVQITGPCGGARQRQRGRELDD